MLTAFRFTETRHIPNGRLSGQRLAKITFQTLKVIDKLTRNACISNKSRTRSGCLFRILKRILEDVGSSQWEEGGMKTLEAFQVFLRRSKVKISPNNTSVVRTLRTFEVEHTHSKFRTAASATLCRSSPAVFRSYCCGLSCGRYPSADVTAGFGARSTLF